MGQVPPAIAAAFAEFCFPDEEVYKVSEVVSATVGIKTASGDVQPLCSGGVRCAKCNETVRAYRFIYRRQKGTSHTRKSSVRCCLPCYERALKGETPKDANVIVRLPGGHSFRCGCGCNVFTKIAPLQYKCNGCGTAYKGEEVDSFKETKT